MFWHEVFFSRYISSPTLWVVFTLFQRCCLGFPDALVVKNPPANAGDARDTGSTPGLGRFPGGKHGSPLQYSCWESPMYRGVWQATAYGVTKGWDTATEQQQD